MRRTWMLVPLFVLLGLLLSSCGGRQAAAQSELKAADTIRYARNLHIEYYDDYVSVRIRDPWDTLRQRQH